MGWDQNAVETLANDRNAKSQEKDEQDGKQAKAAARAYQQARRLKAPSKRHPTAQSNAPSQEPLGSSSAPPAVAQQSKDQSEHPNAPVTLAPVGLSSNHFEIPKPIYTGSPIGHYKVDCEEIRAFWPDRVEDLTLSIRETPTPGLYQATFNFGVIEGMMMLSEKEALLDQSCAGKLPVPGDDDIDHDHDHDHDNTAGVGMKRKTIPGLALPRPRKKTRKGQFFLRLKSREGWTGEIHTKMQEGRLEFNNNGCSSFTAEMGMDFSPRVIFTASKVTDTTEQTNDAWEYYSKEAHKRSRFHCLTLK